MSFLTRLSSNCLSFPGKDRSARRLSSHFRVDQSSVLFSILLSIILVSALQGCGSGSDRNAVDRMATKAHYEKKAGESKRPSMPPVPVATDKVHIGSIASYYSATATLEAEKKAETLARVSGVIREISCEEGDFVERGSELLSVEDKEYRLKLAEAEAKTANLRDKHQRMKDMWKKNLVSPEEYNTTKNELKGAEATEELARLNLSYTVVTAPFKGMIVSRMVDVGQNISIGTPLFVISDFNPLLARVHVPSKEFRKLKPNQPVRLVLDSDRTALKGKIKLISPIIDPTSGTIKVTVEIPEYPPKTRPGDFAEVKIVTDRHDDTFLVPKNSVFSDKGDRVVYIASDGKAERRVVDVGFEDDTSTEILSGVQAGELIVVKGQRSLKHGSPIKIINGPGSKTFPAMRSRAK